ncbi:Glutaredoxin [Zalerion maritima]|uniref:Glutaredoxin n=1 Tax=Zalerion maritima TaxID=339359 RepID=A0AAD5RV81_9PEZI|nr:Glutaredoxin [Zalerion maritima]
MSFLSRLASSMKGPSAASLAAAQETAQRLIDENAVVVFSKTWCGFCSSTKRLLSSFGAEYKILELDTMDDGSELQAALAEMTGQSTVPNVFINHKHIGGNSDLQALRGRLPDMLREAGALKEETM